jgi:diamine N-acetyltransferase
MTGAYRPEDWTATARLQSGQEILIRPLRDNDAAPLGEYFLGLSAETRARYGPHPFNQQTADEICATLDPGDIVRLVATVPGKGRERIIAYMLLKMGVLDGDQHRYEARGIPLDPDTDCTFAPSVADDYQNQGIGSQMLRHILQAAPKLGRRRIALWYGVQATNDRAVHYYTRWGFRKVGEFFTDMNNFDMILDLTAARAADDPGEPPRSGLTPPG